MLDIFELPRVDSTDLFLCSSPWPMVIIVSAYLIFVLKLGRQFMAKREPYDLRGVLMVYNLLQVAYNGILFAAGLYYVLWHRLQNISCLTVLPMDHPLKGLDRTLSYFYYLNKFIDLLDTVFIVLRKSYKQISFLHLLHHLYMPVSGYFVIRLNGFGGHIIVMGLLNLFVHVAMYSYYYLSAQRPQIKGSIWWKQYITVLQMVQFVIIFLHSAWTLRQANCAVSRKLIYMVLFMSAFMFSMFTNFFIHAYIRPRRQLAEQKKE
ncbi:hypothetical protein KR222_006291 [Zaprionus bogoriensis]|nr:hypothetical protein KR222_006291 [Zaprionus bogoriensis]